MAKQSHVRHYLIIVTGCLIMMACTGIAFMTAGQFLTPISDALEVGKGAVSMWMTVALLTMFFFLPFAGQLLAKMDLRVLLTGACLLVGLGQIAFSFAQNVWVLYIASVPIGCGLAVTGYLAIPTLINRWFKTRVGFFMGICMAFSGLGGVIFNQVSAFVIGQYDWSIGYMVMGCCTLVLTLPFTLFVVRGRPEEIGLLPYGAEEAAAASANTPAAATPAVKGVSSSVAMRSAAFFFIALFAGLVGFGGNIYQFMASFASSLPMASTVTGLAATLASAAMIGQVIGKLGLGAINDKSLKLSIAIAMVCGAVGLLVLWLIPNSAIMIYVAGAVFGVFYAVPMVIVPMVARTIFGLRDYDKIYSRVSMVSAIVSAISVTAWGFLIDGTGGYTVVWVGGLIIVAICAILGFASLSAGKKLEQTEG
jgi:MFS family permease